MESCAFIAATIHSSIDATPSPQIPFRPDTRTLPPPSHGIPPLRPRAAKTRFAPEARASLISRSFSLPERREEKRLTRYDSTKKKGRGKENVGESSRRKIIRDTFAKGSFSLPSPGTLAASWKIRMKIEERAGNV